MSEHNVDPSFLRGLTSRRLGRRDVVKLAGLGVAGAAVAACGVKGKATGSATQAPDQVAKFWAGKTAGTHIDFANWPLYMDPEHPELKKFSAQTGISVTYKEVINDDPTWFAKIQPLLSAHQPIGYDLMVMTNGVEFQECVELGYYAPLDHSKMPNFTANAEDKYKNEAFDKNNVYSVPWASGITGIGWNPKYIKTPPTGMNDLLNLAYRGKVGMMSDTQEIGNFGMMALGIAPESSTPADWQKAADWLTKQRNSGVVRKYYDQDYISSLTNGDIWITMAWSGDIFQQNASAGTNLQFLIPSEGGSLWTDNMTIPITAANPVGAMQLINFFYDPAIAASLAEYINYITPVPAAQPIIASDAAAASGDDKAALEQVAKSPLVFPSQSDYAKLHYYRDFKTPAEHTQYQSIFNPIVTS
ncbi:MAG TPA: spermidine/putrescine ABC transporter substrate-binding protein [Micromonosporaceae bacterium]|nr:spermidine/putrescine ABC transporter substrate-binding protein [Micromonosporaceae bacterium]